MAFLTGLADNGHVIGRDKNIPPAKYLTSPLKIEDVVSPGYVDISSILLWEKHGLRPELKRDYGFVRNEIKKIIQDKGRATATVTASVADPAGVTKSVGDRYIVGSNPVGDFVNQWGSIAIVKSDLSWDFRDPEALGYHELSLAEKLVAIKYNLGDLDDHENDPEHDLTVSEIKAINAEYHRDATDNRTYRAQWAQTLVHRDLPDHKGQIYKEMLFSPAGDLIANYINAGNKGTVEDHSASRPNPDAGACDYLNSLSIFSADGATPGLSSKGWTPRRGTLSDLVLEIYNVLVYGIYL